MYANHAEVVSVPVNLCVKLPSHADLKTASYNTVGATSLVLQTLLQPLALADGRSELRTSEITAHLLTNAEVIRLFLPVEIGADGSLGGPATVRVRPAPADAGGRTQGTEAPCSAGT